MVIIVILQIHSFSELKNNQGFWDNFIWPLSVAMVIGVTTIIYKKILSKKDGTSHKIKNIPSEELKCIKVNLYTELCQILVVLLNDNKYLFQTFGPNSSANELGQLRIDMTLWHSSRVDYIIPNNNLLSCLIEKNMMVIPEKYLLPFQKLKSHIYAFKKHVENPTFDYTEYQFPKEIEKIIKDECFVYNIQQDDFLKIKNWITMRLSIQEIQGGFLFGSVMFSTMHNKDIDIVVLLNPLQKAELVQLPNTLNEINHSFKKSFNKHLHFIVFTDAERKKYSIFIQLNLYKTEI